MKIPGISNAVEMDHADVVTHGALFILAEKAWELEDLDGTKSEEECSLEFLRQARPHVEALLDCAEFPQFMRQLLEEKIENETLDGKTLRMYFQSCGLPIPADLRGI